MSRSHFLYAQSHEFFATDVEFYIDTQDNSLNSFNGRVHYLDDDTKRIVEREPIGLENAIWSGCTLNKAEIHGLVIAIGEETRLLKNSKNETRQKTTNIDYKINIFSALLLAFLLAMAIFNASFQLRTKFEFGSFVVATIRFIILLSFLIPISLKLFMMMGRFGYAKQINNDSEIEGSNAKTETIVDELGKIQMILTDKTGTITKNEMFMDKIIVENVLYDKSKFALEIENMYNDKPTAEQLGLKKLAYALVVCNNVVLRYEGLQKCFDASSPDEIAMVRYFESLGYNILYRDDKMIEFADANNEIFGFRILDIFPFESARKRMGVIVEEISYGNGDRKLWFYLKGADQVVKEKVSEQQDKLAAEENTLLLATEGLRTLCFASKELSEFEYLAFKHKEKENLCNGHRLANEKLVSNLESGMKLLGVTGVKDLLQDNVQNTFTSIEQAMLKLWVLTGDKLETAQHICKSTGLAKRDRAVRIIAEVDEAEIRDMISTAEGQIHSLTNVVLLIDGDVLKRGLEIDEIGFIKYCLGYNYVCFSRCTPSQKFTIAEVLKKKLKKRILTVGDGGNDVGMIQVANIGVGIYGKEGNQAALAADFTINKFCYLSKLVFYHGRNAHRGISHIAQFILHRGLIISWTQQIFSTMFYMISMPIFNGFLMVSYSSIFTVFPVLCVIYDHDIKWSKLQDYLNFYSLSGKGANVKFFLCWVFISIYQASAIFLTSLLIFENFFANFVGIVFTTLILVESFNVLFLVSKLSKLLILAITGTLALYFISVGLMKPLFTIDIFDHLFFVKVLIVFGIAWTPVYAAFELARTLNKHKRALIN